MNGIINFNKPTGITSCKAINLVKKALKIKKAGHTGTLDPNANGVLPICLGNATKVVQYIVQLPKTYYGKMRLGIRTDTQDADGKTIAKCANFGINRSLIEEIFPKYTGAIEQIPPMYSAARVNGQRLYTLARKGISISRNPKKVFIYYLKLLDYHNDIVTFEAKTSAGTYIRTLCDDMGNELGCGAHLAELTRTRVGELKIEDSITLEELKQDARENCFQNKINSIDKTLSFLPYIEVKEENENSVLTKMTIMEDSINDISKKINGEEYWRVRNSSGKLLGIATSLLDENFAPSEKNKYLRFKLKKLLV